MQRFQCPFCGLRDETEFHFATEAGKSRPEPAEEVTDAEWAAYLHLNDALKGQAREVWVHLTCGEYFLMTRDTLTREVSGSEALPGRAS
ncbi:sarcosine oxidase subunit delta [Limibaculum sp. M0105]|uniref:Sarcosine oxidase subunit delta n=1 Tax=Thermohalobaculum xanthum TaxID=2753746 RepID=A0A8J7M729_9RHOB|nr:sarcosine oxidase subunit delta [Thermohalobaculum xanthum]MBK0399554.1 sarcosine oxidase subunit delta [Thermohalobaculum xanthum]